MLVSNSNGPMSCNAFRICLAMGSCSVEIIPFLMCYEKSVSLGFVSIFFDCLRELVRCQMPSDLCVPQSPSCQRRRAEHHRHDLHLDARINQRCIALEFRVYSNVSNCRCSDTSFDDKYHHRCTQNFGQQMPKQRKFLKVWKSF